MIARGRGPDAPARYHGGMPVIRNQDIEEGRRCFLDCQAAFAAGTQDGLSRHAIAMATRYSLHVLEKAAPGPSVEVRVAPWGAVKILPGPDSDPHNLTPPDVVEISPTTWLALATGALSWEDAKTKGQVDTVGGRDDLVARFLPIQA